ncbi:MAG: hypothetical protein H6864_03490 [Micavibrio sp.]|nr:hypothetical protein [Micavibrio sp.]
MGKQNCRADKVQLNKRQAGNIFFALFGAVALVGILGAGVMTFMKGPLATSVKITRMNTAETQMAIGAQVAVMAAANTASSGDCDSDGYVEPLEWRAAGASPAPTGGGLIPLSIGVSKKDPWGTEYGYCSWDHGSSGVCDDETGAGDNPAERLQGDNDSGVYSVVALISAGPDKVFTTTCRDFVTADVNADGDLEDAGDLPLVSKAAETDDDIIFTYTYDEATGASGGLWSIKSGAPDTAVIGKKIETSGMASLQGGVLLPDSALITCDATTAGVMARNASGTGIDICDGAGGWTSLSGGGGGSASTGFNTDNSVACDGTTLGQVRFNTTSQLPEYCSGVQQWLPFIINPSGINLVLTPTTQGGMNVDADNNVDPSILGVCDDAIYYCGTPVTFTLVNSGTLISSTIAYSLTNSTNFYIKSETCTVAGGNVDGKLDPNESCTIEVIPKANGNVAYTGDLQITVDNIPFSQMQGNGTNFGCFPGRAGGGGIYASCGLSSAEGAYDLVVTPGGCTNTTTNPTCAGGTDTKTLAWGSSGIDFYGNGWIPNLSSNGAQATVYSMQYVNATGGSLPAIQWCNDLVYNGYSDWYLPALYEFASNIQPNYAAIGGFINNYYQTATFHSANNAMYVYRMVAGSNTTQYRTSSYYIRCARRNNIPLPAGLVDSTPDVVALIDQIGFSSGGSATSNTVYVLGVYTPISVSMTGGTGMDIIKNGVSTGSTSISGVVWNDSLAFTMDVPTVLGTKNTATITIGTHTYYWSTGYADSSKNVKAFVTAGTTTGNTIGSLTGGDALCNAEAALSSYGLSSNWKVLLSDSGVNAKNRIPWNWKNMTSVGGTVIVDGGITDLFDGSLDAAFNRDYNNNVVSGTAVTSSLFNGTLFSSLYTCTDYTSSGSVLGGSVGSTSSTWLLNAVGSCTSAYRLYCIEDIATTSDRTPATMNVPYKFQVATSTTFTSTQVPVAGMSAGATQTLSVSATGGSPKFTVNRSGVDVAVDVTSFSIQNGDLITFKMNSPASANSSNKMTITAGSMTSYWRIWTGWDGIGTGIKRVFVDDTLYGSGNQGGTGGLDDSCASKASGAGLGGSWKALVSGIAENEWAVNRIGYNWNKLQLVDGTTDVVMAGNIWSTGSTTTSLLAPISKRANGATLISTYVHANTTEYGKSNGTNAAVDACVDWTLKTTTQPPTYTGPQTGSSSSTSVNWIDNDNFYAAPGYSYACYSSTAKWIVYCIEQ